MATNETTALTSASKNALAKADPDLKEVLFNEENLKQMAMALPKHLTADRMARLALTEFRKTPALHKCKTESIIAAVFQASQLGLEFGGVMGQAYMVPYGGEATLIIGYKGLVELARRSGAITNIMAEVVCQNDVFEYEQGLEPKLRHVPARGDRGELTDAYAVAWFKNGTKQFVVMSLDEIEKIRRGSKQGGSGPWKDHFNEMAKKTAIRRLSKQLPLSPEIRVTLDQLDAREHGIPAEPFIDVPFESVSDGEGRQFHPTTGEVLADDEFMPPTASPVPETPSTEAPGQTSLPLGGDDEKY